MPNRNRRNHAPRSAALYDGIALRRDIYRHAVIVAKQEWQPREADHPGGDTGGATCTVEFAALPVGKHLLLLSNQDFDDNLSHEAREEHDKPPRIRFLARVPREWDEIKKRLALEVYDGWQWTWLAEEAPVGDAEHLLENLARVGEPKLERLRQAVESLTDVLETVHHALTGRDRRAKP